jgi:hypothetical protein
MLPVCVCVCGEVLCGTVPTQWEEVEVVVGRCDRVKNRVWRGNTHKQTHKRRGGQTTGVCVCVFGFSWETLSCVVVVSHAQPIRPRGNSFGRWLILVLRLLFHPHGSWFVVLCLGSSSMLFSVVMTLLVIVVAVVHGHSYKQSRRWRRRRG